MAEQVANERVVEGLGVSPGIGIGSAYVCESGTPRIPEYRIRPADVEAEQRRLREAALRARRQLGRLRTKTLGRVKANAEWASEDVLYLLDAYLIMLKDSRLLRGAHARIASERINAEAAVQAETAVICDSFRAMQDAYLSARVEDIREVGNRLVAQLTKESGKPLFSVPRGSIIVAEELTPAEHRAARSRTRRRHRRADGRPAGSHGDPRSRSRPAGGARRGGTAGSGPHRRSAS